MAISLLQVLVASALVWAILRLRKVGSREPGLPPGPPTIPVLGNLHVFPTEYVYLKFTEWAKVYGEIYSLKIANGTAIVVNSPRLVREIFDKRSANTSDRPPMHFVSVVTDGLNVALARYGPTWRTLRRAMQQFLSREACERHFPIQQAEATQLMYDMLKAPDSYSLHIRRNIGSVILSTVFGIRCPRYANSFIAQFFDGQHQWEQLLEPGAHPPVDIIPLLKYIPAKWQVLAKDVKRKQRALYFTLSNMVAKRMEDKKGNGCFLEELHIQKERFNLTDDMLAYVGGACLEGGIDNSAAFLQTFVCCLTAYPEVQAKAHKELDEVIGNQRLPSYEDLERLPYLQAIIKELERFRPVTPLALPHSLSADEMVEGHLLPKGAMLFMNVYALCHDEEVFDHPEVFNPDRFLNNEHGTKPGVDTSDRRLTDLGFGAGRRICPGNQLSHQFISLAVMNLLWAFSFNHPRDPVTGKEMPVTADVTKDFTTGLVVVPKPFKSDIRPRSQAHASLIRAGYAAARPIFSQFEHELSDADAAFVANY
ncbi:cytochrome P450 family protein [Abortiporus biennis]